MPAEMQKAASNINRLRDAEGCCEGVPDLPSRKSKFAFRYGWLGRLAARYRMRVDEFAQSVALDCKLAATNVGWLLAPPLSAKAIERLARQTRCDADRIRALQTPHEWLSDRSHLPYCAKCLFLNRLDVCAPRWKREWLDLDAENCSEHGWPLEWIPAARLSATTSARDRLASPNPPERAAAIPRNCPVARGPTA